MQHISFSLSDVLSGDFTGGSCGPLDPVFEAMTRISCVCRQMAECDPLDTATTVNELLASYGRVIADDFVTINRAIQTVWRSCRDRRQFDLWDRMRDIVSLYLPMTLENEKLAVKYLAAASTMYVLHSRDSLRLPRWLFVFHDATASLIRTGGRERWDRLAGLIIDESGRAEFRVAPSHFHQVVKMEFLLPYYYSEYSHRGV